MVDFRSPMRARVTLTCGSGACMTYAWRSGTARVTVLPEFIESSHCHSLSESGNTYFEGETAASFLPALLRASTQSLRSRRHEHVMSKQPSKQQKDWTKHRQVRLLPASKTSNDINGVPPTARGGNGDVSPPAWQAT